MKHSLCSVPTSFLPKNRMFALVSCSFYQHLVVVSLDFFFYVYVLILLFFFLVIFRGFWTC
jgi:hypothetical protein